MCARNAGTDGLIFNDYGTVEDYIVEVDMNTGEISKPFIMMKNQKEVCAIVKLKSRIKAHKASMTEDFQVLKAIVLAKKREEKIKC